MKTIHVAVLRGGPSTEHDVSLKTGTSVIKNLPAHYSAQDIVIDRAGVWHVRGVPREPHEALARWRPNDKCPRRRIAENAESIRADPGFRPVKRA